jgi:hypothetical protein
MGFDITLGTVKDVVVAVKKEGLDLQNGIDVEAINADVTGVAGVPAPGVAQAVAEFLELESPVIKSIANRITACLLGVTTVANAYGTANDEMLQTIQSKAVQAAASGDFSYFTE